jgi:hypothetical protein
MIEQVDTRTQDIIVDAMLTRAAAECIHYTSEGRIPDIALWRMLSPFDGKVAHSLKINDQVYWLNSNQVAVLRGLLLDYDETVGVEVSKDEERSKINQKVRFQIMARDKFTCCLCGSKPSPTSDVILQVDHVIPVSKGGKSEASNLMTLCKDCNSGKSDDFYPQFLQPEYLAPPDDAYYKGVRPAAPVVGNRIEFQAKHQNRLPILLFLEWVFEEISRYFRKPTKF